MKYILFALNILPLVSCNEKIYPVIQSEHFSLKNDSIVFAVPIYNYYELANYEPHNSNYWVFAKDSVKYFSVFDNELTIFLEKYKTIKRKTELPFSELEIKNCFSFLARGSVDSLRNYLNSLDNKSESKSYKTAFLKVDFVMNKGTGASGLGPMGNFSPFGNYYVYFFVVSGNKLVYFNSMRRVASFFNRFYTPKRSRNTIKAFFKRI